MPTPLLSTPPHGSGSPGNPCGSPCGTWGLGCSPSDRTASAPGGSRGCLSCGHTCLRGGGAATSATTQPQVVPQTAKHFCSIPSSVLGGKLPSQLPPSGGLNTFPARRLLMNIIPSVPGCPAGAHPVSVHQPLLAVPGPLDTARRGRRDLRIRPQ